MPEAEGVVVASHTSGEATQTLSLSDFSTTAIGPKTMSLCHTSKAQHEMDTVENIIANAVWPSCGRCRSAGHRSDRFEQFFPRAASLTKCIFIKERQKRVFGGFTSSQVSHLPLLTSQPFSSCLGFWFALHEVKPVITVSLSCLESQ